jgi:Mrp family chromosome partitioning ATPase
LLWSLAGLAAGLLVGAAVALIAARRSVRPRRPRRPAAPPERAHGREGAWLEGALGAPVIAAFGDPDPLLSPPRGGEAPDLDDGKLAIYREALGALGLGGDSGPKTLAVMALGGDCDAIGVALGLAAAAAEDGLRVIVVETDLAAPALAARLGVRPSPGLRDYLNRDAGPRDVMRTLPAATASGPIVCVPAGEQDGRPARVAGHRFEGLAERLPRVYDVVLFCAPPLLADADAAAVAAAAEGVIAVAPASESASSAVTRAARMLRPERPLGTISTRI